MTEQVTTDPEAQVTATLNALGDTPDAIADRLRALGIKGRRIGARHCPIAQLLNTLDGVSNAAVFDDSISFSKSGGWGAALPTSAAVEFIRRFDQGVYLDLVEVAA